MTKKYRRQRLVRSKSKKKKPNLQTFLLNIYAGEPMPDDALRLFQPKFLQ